MEFFHQNGTKLGTGFSSCCVHTHTHTPEK